MSVDIKDVLAIGDQENDISMIKYAGIGVAMGDGEESLLKVADFVTKPFHEEGFNFAVEQLILNHH